MKPVHVKARSTVPGTGELSQALEEARDRETLKQFCSAHVCTAAEVSEDGRRLSMPRMLDLMRTRGYQVADPRRSPHQPKRGLTAWLVHIVTDKAEFTLAFYTPETARADASAERKNARTRSLEPA